MTSDADLTGGPSAEVGLWSVSAVTPTDWSQFTEQLDQWEQGHLLLDLPLTWLTPSGFDPVTGVTSTSDEVKPAYSTLARTNAFIIASQTCDIGALPPGDKHPFILAAPLIPSTTMSRGQAKKASEFGVGYLFPTVAPPLGETGDSDVAWFADLRVLVPLSKGVLLDRIPAPGFADEATAFKFATAVAYKFRRPALHPILSEDLPRLLDQFIKETGLTKSAFTQTEQVRLRVTDGELLHAKAVQVLVLGEVELTDGQQDMWRGWEARGKTLVRGAEMELGPTLFTTAEKLSAANYRTTIPLRLDNLGPTPWW